LISDWHFCRIPSVAKGHGASLVLIGAEAATPGLANYDNLAKLAG